MPVYPHADILLNRNPRYLYYKNLPYPWLLSQSEFEARRTVYRSVMQGEVLLYAKTVCQSVCPSATLKYRVSLEIMLI